MTDHSAHSDTPLVSIIIACYGCREFIGDAIESALAQTYHPLEILVIENCGTDGTYEKALTYVDPRLRVVRNEVNLGLYANKNRGNELTHGEFIKYLDGDDVLEPDCVEKLIEGWRQAGRNVGVVFGQYSNIDKEGNQQAQPRLWGISGRCNGLAVLDVVTQMKPGGSVFGNPTPHLIERGAMEKVGGFAKENSFIGDLELFLKLLCVTDVAFIPDIVARYRRQPSSLSGTSKSVSVIKDGLTTLDRLLEFFEQQKVPSNLKDPQFIKQWKFEASARFIFLHYLKRILRRENQFDEIRRLFFDCGLGEGFDRTVRARLGGYIYRSYMRKLRVLLGVHEMEPLFDRRSARLIEKV